MLKCKSTLHVMNGNQLFSNKCATELLTSRRFKTQCVDGVG